MYYQIEFHVQPGGYVTMYSLPLVPRVDENVMINGQEYEIYKVLHDVSRPDCVKVFVKPYMQL